MDFASATPLERRFIGATRLVTLHLWRVAKSTDLDEGFACARKLGMIDEANEAFIRECLDMAAALEVGGASEAGEKGNAGETGGASEAGGPCSPEHPPITPELIDELQACVLRLNSADPA